MNTDDPRTGCRGEDLNLCSGGEHDLTEGDPPLTAGSMFEREQRDAAAPQLASGHIPSPDPAASGAPLAVRLLNVCELALVVGPLAVLTARGWWLA